MLLSFFIPIQVQRASERIDSKSRDKEVLHYSDFGNC
jgi:hypothetical protein